MKRILILLVLAALAGSAVAQTASPMLIPFQGRLTDQNGVAYTNGQYTIVFQLYDQAVGGTLLWNERHEKVGVINGMMNVFLGSISSLTNVSFASTRYLGITVDGDNNANTPDPEMVPRQVIIPAFWAKQADNAINSAKLAGYDWTPLFGVNNPNASIPGTKLQVASISGDRLQPGSVTSAALYARTTNNPATQGNIAIGPSANLYYTSSGSVTPVDVPGLSATLATTGRPVLVMLVPGTRTTANELDQSYLSVDATQSMNIYCYRNTTNMLYNSYFGNGGSGSSSTVPPGAVSFVDFAPGIGTTTYSFQYKVAYPSKYFSFSNVRVMAFEF